MTFGVADLRGLAARVHGSFDVVLDNYSVHHGKDVKAVEAESATAGVVFFYLPPYGPELNPVEHLWRHVKYEALQVRSCGQLTVRQPAVDCALTLEAAHVRQPTTELCEAAWSKHGH